MQDALHITYELFRDVWGFGAFGAWLAQLIHEVSLRAVWGALASVLLVACTSICALRLSRWLLPHAGIAMRWCAVSSVGMWCASAGFHALRSLHAFQLGHALIACAGLAWLCERSLPGLGARACLQREWRALRAVARLARRSPHVWLNACFGAFALLLTLRALLIPPLGWDTLTYHGPRAVQWLQTGQFTFDDGVGCYNFYRHFTSGGEVFSAWAMLPFHSDLLVNLASVVQWLALFMASWALARALGLREPYASTSAAVVMFLPAVQLEVSSGYVELPLNAALFQGIALAVHSLKRPSAGSALLCAMSLGVAASIKLPGMPPALVVAAGVALRLVFSRQLSWRAKLRTAAISCIFATLPAAPFLLRAYQDTGYPLSPMPVRAFGHTLGVASDMMRWYQERPQPDAFTWAAEKKALHALFAPLARFNESIGSMGVLLLFGAPFGLCASIRRKPLLGLLLACAALTPLLAHFGRELSAVRLMRAPSSTRFLLPFLALCAPLSLSWCTPHSALARTYRRLLLLYPLMTSFMAFKRDYGEWEARDHAGLLIVLVLAASLLSACARWGRGPLWAASLGVWILFACGLQARRDETRDLAMRDSSTLHGYPKYWTKAPALVDELERPRRIAITGGPDPVSDKWFHYFFYGRRFQNSIHYVTPTRDGSIVQLRPPRALDKRSDRDVWLANLERRGITEVLSFPPRSLELGYMDKLPERFEKLDGDGSWGLYRVLPAPAP